ncbi:MAG: trypsin-like peptidase domain-containing protein [Spirochaetales bacterium]|nr:trypsin-like peptidase domain-containing protein [Spirochaetales bacterium]
MKMSKLSILNNNGFVVLLFCCITGLFFSCNTVYDIAPGYIPPLEAVQKEDIEKMLAQGNYLDAVQYINRIERSRNGLLKEELEKLRNQTIDMVKADFQSSMDKKDYEKAIAYVDSAINIGEPALFPGWSVKKLLMMQAELQEQQGNDSVAVLTAIKAMKHETLTNSEYSHILELATKLENKTAILTVIAEMEKRHMPIPEPARVITSKITPIKKVIDGTVTIWVYKGIKFENGVGMPNNIVGSGFFIDPRGFILTNYHVIESEVNPQYEGYSRLYIRLSDMPDQRIPARVISYDPVFDLALLKTEIDPKYIFSSIGETSIDPGDKIKVIGSPGGLENTVTSGIVSATGRRFLQLGDAMQIDAPVNPGNSGGPIIDEDGRLVGIVFAGIEQFEGLNFGVSIEWINKVLPRMFPANSKDLSEYIATPITHYWMGCAVEKTEKGMEIIYVVPGEPAYNAGLRGGDLITGINGKEFKTLREIQSLMVSYESKTLLAVSCTRDNEAYTAYISLSPRPRVPVSLALERDSKVNVIYPLFGMKIDKVADEVWNNHYVVRRIIPGSSADELGLSVNDPISIREWFIHEKLKVVMIQVMVKRRKLGFLETFIQLLSFLETTNFI